MINRNLFDIIKNAKKSVLLLGPRQVGKSTLMNTLNPDLSVNLAYQDTFLEYASNPKALLEAIESSHEKTIFIDEIQRLPSLLHTVQYLIDNDKALRFYLTGSSARKLKRGRANLLPGRIFDYQMGPIVCSEFNYKMNIQKVLEYGCLPEVYLCDKPAQAKKMLASYASIYLKEEIQAEALSRNLESFSRFLKAVVNETGRFIDYSKLAKIAKISRHLCSRYFEVLEDTLIGYRLFPFEPCLESADLIKHPKFYFFDVGIYNGMVLNFTASPDRAGILSEQLLFSQIWHSAKSLDKDINISTFRTRGGIEIDFICEVDKSIFAIEVKANDNLSLNDVKHLQGFTNYYSKKHQRFVFHCGKNKKKIAGIWCLPWQAGLQEIGL